MIPETLISQKTIKALKSKYLDDNEKNICKYCADFCPYDKQSVCDKFENEDKK